MNEKSRRGNYIRQNGGRGMAAWALLLVFIIKIIYMSYKNGMIGMSYYAFASAVFFAVYVLCGIAVVPILRKMVYFQMNRGNYCNGLKVYRVVAGTVLLITGGIAFVLLLFADKISMILFGTVLCSLLIRIMAVALIFWIPAYGLKGYMEGIGNPVPGIFSELSAHIVSLVVTILFQPMFAEYGRRVAALLRQDSYAYAYAACSGALGMAVGGFVSLMLLLLIRSTLGREIRKRIRNEEIRKTDSVQDILWNFFGAYIKSAFVENIGVLLAVVLVILYGCKEGKTANGAGMLYCGIAVISLPAALLAWQMATLFAKQLSAIMKQADFHHAKEKMAFYLKLLSYSVLPYTAAVFLLAPLVSAVLFDAANPEFEIWIRIGAWTGCFLSYSIFFRQTLSVLVKPYVRNLYAAVLGASGILFWFVLSRSGGSAEESIAYAYLLACLLYLLLAGTALLKKIRIYNRLMHSLLLPLIAAAFASVAAFGVYLLTADKINGWILLIFCGVAVCLIHNIITVWLRIFEAHEWKDVPLSGFAVSFAKLIGKY